MRRDKFRSSGGGAAIAVGLVLLFAGASAADERGGPAKVEKIDGSDLKRVTLTAKAIERLGLETAPVREEKVLRRIVVLAEVQEEATGNTLTDATSTPAPISTLEPAEKNRAPESDIRVRLLLDSNPADDSDDDFDDGDDEDDAEIVAFGNDDDVDDDDDDETPVIAKRVPMPATAAPRTLYFKVKSGTLGLEPGQHVVVRVAEPGSDAPKKVIPYSAILYGVNGDTWVYTNPEPLVFVRERVVIERIDQEMAILKDGPAIGAPVVTVGGALLLGTETGVGH